MNKEKVIVSTDKKLLDIDVIYGFLSRSYWAKKRTLQQVQTSIEHSICFGMYYEEKQIGFARVLSDQVVMAYLMDVFIVQEYQDQGLGQHLMEEIFKYPDFGNVKSWLLATNDAHQLYEKFGFELLQRPEVFMERRN